MGRVREVGASKPFEAMLYAVLSIRHDDWTTYFAYRTGIPPGPAESLDTDLATSDSLRGQL